MARLVALVGKCPTIYPGVDITLGVWAYFTEGLRNLYKANIGLFFPSGRENELFEWFMREQPLSHRFFHF